MRINVASIQNHCTLASSTGGVPCQRSLRRCGPRARASERFARARLREAARTRGRAPRDRRLRGRMRGAPSSACCSGSSRRWSSRLRHGDEIDEQTDASGRGACGGRQPGSRAAAGIYRRRRCRSDRGGQREHAHVPVTGPSAAVPPAPEFVPAASGASCSAPRRGAPTRTDTRGASARSAAGTHRSDPSWARACSRSTTRPAP